MFSLHPSVFSYHLFFTTFLCVQASAKQFVQENMGREVFVGLAVSSQLRIPQILSWSGTLTETFSLTENVFSPNRGLLIPSLTLFTKYLYGSLVLFPKTTGQPTALELYGLRLVAML